MTDETRRAKAAISLYDAGGATVEQGEAEAVAGDEALSVGPLTISFLDADALRVGDYRIELDAWSDRQENFT